MEDDMSENDGVGIVEICFFYKMRKLIKYYIIFFLEFWLLIEGL